MSTKEKNPRRSGWWYGRAHVAEKSITPEQYKMFFGLYEFGVTLDMANSLLKCTKDKDSTEVLPCDEMNEIAKAQITEQILVDHTMTGTIEYAGQILDWTWDNLEITCDDGSRPTFFDLADYERERIVREMLDNEYRCGEWNE